MVAPSAVGAIALAIHGMILIREVADAPVITGISKPAGLRIHHWEVRNVEQLYVGIDVRSTKHAAYLMKPDGGKFSSFPMQNNLGGVKMLSEKIVSALTTLGLHDVVIGMEATSIYGDHLVYALQVMSISIAAMRALEKQIKDLNKAIEKQFEIISNTLTSIPSIGKVYSPVSSPRSAISTAFRDRLPQPNTLALSGPSTSPMNSRLKTHVLSSPAIATYVITCWKPPTP